MLFVTPCNALLKHWIEVLRNVILLVVIVFNMSEEGGGYISLLIKYLRRTCSGSYIWIVPTIPWHAPVQSMNRFMVVKISWSAMGGLILLYRISQRCWRYRVPKRVPSAHVIRNRQQKYYLFLKLHPFWSSEQCAMNMMNYNTCSGSEDDTCFVIILSFISFN